MSLKKAWLLAGALVVVGGAGCTKPNPALSCEDGLCSDPNVPFCDVTGAISGEANTCIKPSCTANAFEECRGDKALMCNATGSDYDLVTCSQGCSADTNGCKPEPPCETLNCKKHIIPKYLPTECDTLATNGALTISADAELDTSDDSKCTRIVQQPSGPDICVLHYRSIAIESNKTFGVTGSRVLALVSDEPLVIDGVLDVGFHNGYMNGPAGGLVTSGGFSALGATGGGGAGGRTAGGSGGTTQTGGAANGGGAVANPATLAYVLGGHRSGGNPFNNSGGAALLVACRGALKVQGTVDVSGGGGQNGYLQDNGNGGFIYRSAKGGGAAGTVVLQGLSLVITGQLYANGGGGGGGGGDGGPGYEGQRSTAAAAGGAGTATGGTGGAGGALGPPQGGGSETNGRGGGGGGAAGYFFAYSPGTGDDVTPSAVSPAIEPKGVIATN